MGDVDVSRSPTECPLCYESYTHEGGNQPRMIIPCGHTVCFTCINKLASQPVMMCPICRKKCPSRFINEAGFPINYLAITLLENQKKQEESSINASRCSSNSDVTSRSPKLKRSTKSPSVGGLKNGGGGAMCKQQQQQGNECSECRKGTDKLCFCFHCASPLCEECKAQHTEGVVADLEKQANTLQEQKRLLVKKIEALQRMVSTLDDNCHETETDIDDNFTIIQHEVTEAKSRLMDSLNQKYQKEKQRLQTHCETLTEALEKAGDAELPEIMDKNVTDITGNEIAILCEFAMDLMVSLRNLQAATKQIKMKYTTYTFAHGDKLSGIRAMLQKFGSIRTHSRQPKPEQWDPEDDNTDGGQEGGDNEGAGSDGGSGVSLDDDLLSDDDESVTLRKRPNRRHTMASERHGKHRDDVDESDISLSDKEAPASRPLTSYNQRSASVFLGSNRGQQSLVSPVHTSGSSSRHPGGTAGSGGAGVSTSAKGPSGGVRSKVRNKLVKQQSGGSLIRSASLNLLDRSSISDADLSDVSRKSSVVGGPAIQQSVPVSQNYASLKEKYENIRGPVTSLIYRENNKITGHVLDVVARYRSNGFVVADNNEYMIRAFNSNYHLSACFSFKLNSDDIPFISGIAATSDKIFLLVDSKNKHVRVFDRKGTHLRDIGKELFQRPKDVCTDDTEIFVTDSGASCVQVFDMDGVHLRTLGGPGSADGEFLWPAGMKMTSEGKLVICDCNNNRIQYISKDGDHIQNITSIYGTYSALRPTCVDLDKENNVIVLFAESRRVKIYNKDLQVLNDFRVEDELNSVAVTCDGWIALVDGSKTGKCFVY